MKWVIFVCLLYVAECIADLPEVPNLDDIDAIRERCDKKGGKGTYEKVKKARNETETCVKDLIDVEAIQNELEEAKKTGSMEEVFGKYCAKRPEIKVCIKKSLDAIEPCLEETEKTALNMTLKILGQIGDFACYRDGDRLAMFVSEGGVECLQSRAEGIKNCFNKTLKFNPNTFSPNSITNIAMDQKKCTDLSTIQDCVVTDLENNCSETTPANVIDALFRFVKKSACKDIKRKRSISLKRHIRNVLTTTQTQLIAAMVEKLNRTCKRNGGDFDGFLVAFDKTKECLKTYKLFTTPLNIYNDSILHCSTDLRKKFENCLKEDEKYYSGFIVEMLQSVIGFIYRNADRIIATQSNTTLVCVNSLNNDEAHRQLLKCSNSSINVADEIVIPPKSKLCENIVEQLNCAINIIKNICPNNIHVVKYMEDFSHSVRAPCRNTTETKNKK